MQYNFKVRTPSLYFKFIYVFIRSKKIRFKKKVLIFFTLHSQYDQVYYSFTVVLTLQNNSIIKSVLSNNIVRDMVKSLVCEVCQGNKLVFVGKLVRNIMKVTFHRYSYLQIATSIKFKCHWGIGEVMTS